MSIHGVNARQLQIIGILKEAKCTNTAELQEELGVSRRTLRMDIAYLKRVYPDKLITHRQIYRRFRMGRVIRRQMIYVKKR